MPPKREFNWLNLTFLTISPFAALIGVGLYVYHQGIRPSDLANFWFMFWMTGLGITAGYHRFYSHRTYDCHPILQVVYLLFGAAAFENSVAFWCSDHRYHHRFVDTEDDPYNIMKGIFWAHIGWIFYKGRPDRNFENIKDLMDDWKVRAQNDYYLPIAIGVGMGLPFLIGMAFGRPWGGFLWGGLLRIVLVQHATFLINSAAHFIGQQNYSNKDSSRDNWWLAFFTFGEGYHNYHHTFQGDYRNGVLWYHWDPAKWLISAGSWFGLTSRLNRASEWTIMKARLQMEYLKIKPLLEQKPESWREKFDRQCDALQKRAELAMVHYQQTKKLYQEWATEARASAQRERESLEASWEARMKEYRIAAAEAKKEYFRLLNEVQRSHAPAGIMAFVAIFLRK